MDILSAYPEGQFPNSLGGNTYMYEDIKGGKKSKRHKNKNKKRKSKKRRTKRTKKR